MARGQPGQVAQGGWLLEPTSRGRLARPSPRYGSVTQRLQRQPGRQGQSRPRLSLHPGGERHPAREEGTRPLPQAGLLTHHVGDKGTGHSHRPPRRAPPEPSVPNRVPLCRSAPTHFCRLGGIQNPPEIGPSRAQPLNLPRKALLSCRKRMNIPPFHPVEPVPSFSARGVGPGQAQS